MKTEGRDLYLLCAWSEGFLSVDAMPRLESERLDELTGDVDDAAGNCAWE
jgi:hypothetical protein